MTVKYCRDCVWCVLEDDGYSNYTVENTRQGCLLKLNPKFPLEDSFYGKEPGNEFAEQCPSFKAGSPTHIDVDHEYSLHEYAANDEVKARILLIMPPEKLTGFSSILDFLYSHRRQQ